MLLRDMGVGEALLNGAAFISIAMLPLLPLPFIARHVGTLTSDQPAAVALRGHSRTLAQPTGGRCAVAAYDPKRGTG
jgi:hypothetical protein